MHGQLPWRQISGLRFLLFYEVPVKLLCLDADFCPECPVSVLLQEAGYFDFLPSAKVCALCNIILQKKNYKKKKKLHHIPGKKSNLINIELLLFYYFPLFFSFFIQNFFPSSLPALNFLSHMCHYF